MTPLAFLRQMLEAGVPQDVALAIAEKFEVKQEAERAQSDAARRAKDAARAARRRALMPDDWFSLRAEVFERDGYVCTYCEEQTEEPHCDHIVPLSRGGSNDPSNLTTACRECNTSKGARTVEEWEAAR